jgi:cell division protein FtsI/penicillin-binding protein 2
MSAAEAVDFEHLPQALPPATAVQLRRILCDVVVRGTAKGCRSVVWNISGKTGTSHISEGRSGYSPTRYNSSFVACAPAEDPKIVVAFVIHDPSGEKAEALHYFGGSIAAPGACRVIEQTLTYMNVPGSPPLPLPPAQVAGRLWEYQTSQTTDRSFGAPKNTDQASAQ